MAQKTSERFRAADSDISFLSSDGVLFKIHTRNLSQSSEAFAAPIPSAAPGHNEAVPMSESSDVLELLFQYMYLEPQPNLQHVKFETVDGLVEAAEKFLVHSAISVCRMRMKEFIPTHTEAYAMKHNHPDILDAIRKQENDAAEHWWFKLGISVMFATDAVLSIL